QLLLDSRYPALGERSRRRLLAEAQGNPLALLELPIALNSADADWALPATLPLTERLQNAFAARIKDLPEPTRRALLLAGLDGTGDLRVLGADGSGTPVDELEAAERAHAVSLDVAAARISFRHPLIRSAVVALATDAERREAHRVLARRRA